VTHLNSPICDLVGQRAQSPERGKIQVAGPALSRSGCGRQELLTRALAEHKLLEPHARRVVVSALPTLPWRSSTTAQSGPGFARAGSASHPILRRSRRSAPGVVMATVRFGVAPAVGSAPHGPCYPQGGIKRSCGNHHGSRKMVSGLGRKTDPRALSPASRCTRVSADGRNSRTQRGQPRQHGPEFQ
jgi:hypothetical protein